jgi:hypothetical protein
MVDQDAARTAAHAAGSTQPLGAGFAADHIEHRLIGPFDDNGAWHTPGIGISWPEARNRAEWEKPLAVSDRGLRSSGH